MESLLGFDKQLLLQKQLYKGLKSKSKTSYLCQGGFVFAWVCLSVVWVFVCCLFVNKITQKLMDGF